MKKYLSLFLVFFMLILLTGCFKVAKYPKISVGGKIQRVFFEDTLDSKREIFLQNHEKELEYTKFKNTFFLVYCQDLFTEGYIWIYPCSYDVTEYESFIVKNVYLTTNCGNTICENTNINMQVFVTNPHEIYSNENMILNYDVSNDWYYSGNKLKLVVEVQSGDKTKEISYPVNIYTVRNIVFPT